MARSKKEQITVLPEAIEKGWGIQPEERSDEEDCEFSSRGLFVKLLSLMMVLGLTNGISNSQVCSAEFSTEKLDVLSLDRYKQLRETERYQMKIADGYYLKNDWKVAADEYEKFLTLYERSEGAPFAQLRWSICQVRLRKLNTAIRDGFQSVIDYWPDSPDAKAAHFLMGRCYKEMGETKQARKVYQDVLEKHPKDEIAVYALVDLVDLATINEDDKACVELWKKLTFEAPRKSRQTQTHCANASRNLAIHYFTEAAFPKAVEAFETTYKNDFDLLTRINADILTPLRNLNAKTSGKKKAEQLSAAAITFNRSKMPTDLKDEQVRSQAKSYYFGIIGIQKAMGEEEKVPQTFAEMEKKFGVEDDILTQLAGWLKSKKKYEEARKTYRRFNNKILGGQYVAESYREEQNFTAAIEAYHALVGLDPENEVRWKSEVALTQRYAKQHPQAIATYQELIKLDALNGNRWLVEIGNTHRDFGKYKEAIGAFRQCTNYPENYKQMAYCHRRLKQYNESRTLYAQIAGTHAPSAPWALYQIAETWREQKQKEKAILAYQNVCKQFPKDSYASRAHALLQSQYKITVTLGGAKDE